MAHALNYLQTDSLVQATVEVSFNLLPFITAAIFVTLLGSNTLEGSLDLDSFTLDSLDSFWSLGLIF